MQQGNVKAGTNANFPTKFWMNLKLLSSFQLTNSSWRICTARLGRLTLETSSQGTCKISKPCSFKTRTPWYRHNSWLSNLLHLCISSSNNHHNSFKISSSRTRLSNRLSFKNTSQAGTLENIRANSRPPSLLFKLNRRMFITLYLRPSM